VTVVYHSGGGQRYHETRECPAWHRAQDLNDWDSDEPYSRGPQLHALEEGPDWLLAKLGKVPCLFCKPPFITQHMDFEHFPAHIHQPECVDPESCGSLCEQVVCARCCIRRRVRATSGTPPWTIRRPVMWPCTSAVVLGLTKG
jgi:hypothetical protein